MIKFKKLVSNKKILGFNTGHNGGAALFSAQSMCSISEERLNRLKNSDGYLYATEYCLDAANIDLDDVDLFVSSSYHARLPENYSGQFKSIIKNDERFITVDHHLSHAYASYFLSGHDKALIVIIDGLGNDNDTESYYTGNNGDIQKIGGNNPERSMYKGIGRAYEVFTNYCGWSAQEAGKTMGLSALGESKYPDVKLFDINDNLEISSRIEGKYLDGAIDFVSKNNLDFGKPESFEKNKDAAFYVQQQTEEILLELIKRLKDKYPEYKNLCLGGGVFLNGIVNKKIIDTGIFENVFIPPCCDDTGQPIGNALFGLKKLQPEIVPSDFGEIPHAYTARSYSEEEILDVLERKQKVFTLPYSVKSLQYKYKKLEDTELVSKVADLLVDGAIIGWLEGSSEIGPRALGHRSILCKPFPAKMKDIVNERIKHREGFRPFAPIILEEKAADFFDLTTSAKFMLKISKSLDVAQRNAAAIVHYDDTARVQTINEDNGRIFDLLRSFNIKTDIPVLLNTSFNDNGEPIVETPKDAMIMFAKGDLDYLVIENYLVWRK